MAEVTTVPDAALIAIAVIALLGASIGSIILAALNRITRSQAAEAYADDSGGHRTASIVDRRPAAGAVTSAIRSLLLIWFGGAITIFLATIVHNLWLLLLVLVIIGAVVMLVMNMLLPSGIGYKYPVRVLKLFGGPLWFLTRLGSIFVTRRDNAPEEEKVTQEEDQLAVMVERVSESEALEDDERDMLHSVFELSRTLVREVMVPRTDMISITADQPLDKALSLFTRSGYSRVPVIGDSVDDLQGVLYLKDVIRRIHHRNDAHSVAVSDVMREPVFVPETMMVDDLMHDMQADSIHIALVVDEYGGIAGLVTIEDLLEELVGEMVDEHDRALPEVEQVSDGLYRIPARMPLDELGEMFDIKIEDDDVDTAGGLLAKALGRVPIVGSEANVLGLNLRADRFEGRRKRLSFVLASRVHDEEENDD